MEPTPDETLLTAYLDGELAPQDRQLLEQRLAEEEELRQRLNLLEETWHYLDLLERDEVDAEKIETTLKVLAVSMSGAPFPALKTSRWGQWTIAALLGLVFFVLFFQFGQQSLHNDPSFRQMVARLDLYLAIVNEEEGLELLRQLAVQRVFLPPLPDEAPMADISEYEPNFRLQFSNAFNSSVVRHWDEFDTRDSDQLFYRNIQTYRRLSREKTKQIRQLHRAIEGAPRQVELLLTMQNYYHWLKSLQAYEKTALRQPKSLVEKVNDIVELKTKLDRLLPRDPASMPSEIVGMDESQRLAQTLENMSFNERERILNDEPHQIINELKQLSHR